MENSLSWPHARHISFLKYFMGRIWLLVVFCTTSNNSIKQKQRITLIRFNPTLSSKLFSKIFSYRNLYWHRIREVKLYLFGWKVWNYSIEKIEVNFTTYMNHGRSRCSRSTNNYCKNTLALHCFGRSGILTWSFLILTF